MNSRTLAEIDAIAGYILEDYSRERTIDKLDVFNQPDKDEILSLLKKLMQVVFPGYYKDNKYKIYNVKNNLSVIIEDILYNLNKQIAVTLKSVNDDTSKKPEWIEARAHKLTTQFLATIPKVREYVETDVLAAYEGDPAATSYDEIIYCYPGLYAITVNRLAHELYLLGVPLIPRIMTEYAHSRTGIDIHPGATLGKYFFIDHGTGIVIGETTEIGEHVKIYQGVTLGALSTRGGQDIRGQKRHPTIEDYVTIYSGASILGGETVIGKNAIIGGNAFITSSVEAGARVIANK